MGAFLKNTIVTGKFKKNSNGCATFTLQHEESQFIDYNSEYLIEIKGRIDNKREKFNRMVITIS